MDEIFDIVDDRDVVIGQRARREVHRLGLKHRAVHVLVFNRSGQLYLQKRSKSKDTFPGAWDSSAAGHLEVGESYDAAAVRELEEELGLVSDQSLEFLFKLGACPNTGEEFVRVFRIENEGPFTLNREEIDCGGWYSPEKISRWISERPSDFPDAFILIWNIFTGRYT